MNPSSIDSKAKDGTLLAENQIEEFLKSSEKKTEDKFRTDGRETKKMDTQMEILSQQSPEKKEYNLRPKKGLHKNQMTFTSGKIRSTSPITKREVKIKLRTIASRKNPKESVEMKKNYIKQAEELEKTRERLRALEIQINQLMQSKQLQEGEVNKISLNDKKERMIESVQLTPHNRWNFDASNIERVRSYGIDTDTKNHLFSKDNGKIDEEYKLIDEVEDVKINSGPKPLSERAPEPKFSFKIPIPDLTLQDAVKISRNDNRIAYNPIGISIPALKECTPKNCLEFLRKYNTYKQIINTYPGIDCIPVAGMISWDLLPAITDEMNLRRKKLTDSELLEFIEEIGIPSTEMIRDIKGILFPKLIIRQGSNIDANIWYHEVSNLLKQNSCGAYIDRRNPSLLKKLQKELLNYMENFVKFRMKQFHKLGKGYFDWDEYIIIVREAVFEGRKDKEVDENRNNSTTWKNRSTISHYNESKRKMDNEIKKVELISNTHQAKNVQPKVDDYQEKRNENLCLGCKKYGHRIDDCTRVTDLSERKKIKDEFYANKKRKDPKMNQ